MYKKEVSRGLGNTFSTNEIVTCHSPISGFGALFKRIFDVAFSLMAIIALLPVLAFIALRIKLDSPGPVLFKQKRNGLGGKEISVWKFRTMVVMEDGADLKQATRDDDRVTAFGRFLRRSSLDELPQFFNVLQGSMSVVGPRPHAVAHNKQFRSLIENYSLRHMALPGITGWAQINGARGETDTIDKMELRVKLDLEYIENWSPWLDIHIVFLTVARGFCNRNAY